MLDLMANIWHIRELLFEEEQWLNREGIKTALAIFGDYAVTIIDIRTEEELFFVQLKFGDRLHIINPNDFLF